MAKQNVVTTEVAEIDANTTGDEGSVTLNREEGRSGCESKAHCEFDTHIKLEEALADAKDDKQRLRAIFDGISDEEVTGFHESELGLMEPELAARAVYEHHTIIRNDDYSDFLLVIPVPDSSDVLTQLDVLTVTGAEIKRREQNKRTVTTILKDKPKAGRLTKSEESSEYECNWLDMRCEEPTEPAQS
jgi:hypothetical protein